MDRAVCSTAAYARQSIIIVSKIIDLTSNLTHLASSRPLASKQSPRTWLAAPCNSTNVPFCMSHTRTVPFDPPTAIAFSFIGLNATRRDPWLSGALRFLIHASTVATTDHQHTRRQQPMIHKLVVVSQSFISPLLNSMVASTRPDGLQSIPYTAARCATISPSSTHLPPCCANHFTLPPICKSVTIN